MYSLYNIICTLNFCFLIMYCSIKYDLHLHLHLYICSIATNIILLPMKRPLQKPGTIGMWVAYDPESNTLIIDTEGLLG